MPRRVLAVGVDIVRSSALSQPWRQWAVRIRHKLHLAAFLATALVACGTFRSGTRDRRCRRALTGRALCRIESLTAIATRFQAKHPASPSSSKTLRRHSVALVASGDADFGFLSRDLKAERSAVDIIPLRRTGNRSRGHPAERDRRAHHGTDPQDHSGGSPIGRRSEATPARYGRWSVKRQLTRALEAISSAASRPTQERDRGRGLRSDLPGGEGLQGRHRQITIQKTTTDDVNLDSLPSTASQRRRAM